MTHHQSVLVKAKEQVIDVTVKNPADEQLGTIYEIMLDKVSGKVAYAVLESGSFLGMSSKLYALPWSLISYDPEKSCFILNVDKETLKTAPGFDKDNWPDMADKGWGQSVSDHFSAKVYDE